MNIQTRSVVTCVLLTIVTCGIYGIYWTYCIINDTYTLTNVDGSAGMDTFLIYLTCGLYGLYIWYKIGNLLAAYRADRGLSEQNNAILYLVLALLGLLIVDLCIIQSELNTYTVDIIQ